MKPCTCNPPRFRMIGGCVAPYDRKTDCHYCVRFAVNAELHRQWGGTGPVYPQCEPNHVAHVGKQTGTPTAMAGTPLPLPMLRPKCRHLSENVVQYCNCLTGQDYNNVHFCMHPSDKYGNEDGHTTRHSLNNPAAWKCSECEGYERFEPITTRNILFHLAPFKGTPWEWHADQLKTRIGLFNGRRILATMTGPRLAHHREVQERFPDFEVIAVRNDPRQREVATFLPLFERLAHMGNRPGSATLYAHGKGATRGTSTRRWTEMLYGSTVDVWPKVERVLKAYPIAGPFLKEGEGWPKNESHSTWHYSGSFFWFRDDELFKKPDWRRIDPFWSGIEPYLSIHFPLDEAGCTFHRGPCNGDGRMNLYDVEYMNRLEPLYAEYMKGAA